MDPRVLDAYFTEFEKQLKKQSSLLLKLAARKGLTYLDYKGEVPDYDVAFYKNGELQARQEKLRKLMGPGVG